jgi:hypothetical protein
MSLLFVQILSSLFFLLPLSINTASSWCARDHSDPFLFLTFSSALLCGASTFFLFFSLSTWLLLLMRWWWYYFSLSPFFFVIRSDGGRDPCGQLWSSLSTEKTRLERRLAGERSVLLEFRSTFAKGTHSRRKVRLFLFHFCFVFFFISLFDIDWFGNLKKKKKWHDIRKSPVLFYYSY